MFHFLVTAKKTEVSVVFVLFLNPYTTSRFIQRPLCFIGDGWRKWGSDRPVMLQRHSPEKC